MDIEKALRDNCFGKRSADIYYDAKYVDMSDFNSGMSGIFSCIEQQKFFEEMNLVEFVPAEQVARNYCKLLGEDFSVYQWYIGSFGKFDSFTPREIHEMRVTAFGEIKRPEVKHYHEDLIDLYKDSYRKIVKEFHRGYISEDEAMQEIYNAERHRILNKLTESDFGEESHKAFSREIEELNMRFPFMS